MLLNKFIDLRSYGKPMIFEALFNVTEITLCWMVFVCCYICDLYFYEGVHWIGEGKFNKCGKYFSY